MHSPNDVAFEQPGFFENADVLGDARLRNRKSRSNFPDRHRLPGQPLDNPPARGIGECAEDCVQVSTVNHEVI